MDERETLLRDLAFEAGWDAGIKFHGHDAVEAVQTAYERGWRDACDDHMHQEVDPTWPIGRRRQSPYSPDQGFVPRPERLDDDLKAAQ